MQDTFTGVLIGLIAAGALYATWKLSRRGRRKSAPPAPPTIQTYLTEMRAIGELNVFRMMTKQVMTRKAHLFGEFGSRHLRWLLTEQQVTLVLDFYIDFLFDLADPRFDVVRTGPDSCRITLPPCRHSVMLQDMQIQREDDPKLLPLLVPDILNRFFVGGSSVDQKNQIIQETRAVSEKYTAELVPKVESIARRSAQNTLSSLARGMGMQTVEILYLEAPEFQTTVDFTELERRLRGAV